MGDRLFVSVDLDGMAEAVAAIQERFEGASGLRFTDPKQTHVTLKFLGDTPQARRPDLVDQLDAAVDDAGVDPFTATVGGLGVFPDIEYISVVWLGVREGSEKLRALHEGVEERTVAMGYDPADHEFTPHATIARMDHAGGKELVQQRIREGDPAVGDLAVEEVRLTESVREAEGPAYSTVARFPL